MKGNEGVTILQIVITIIVMMLILSASVFYGVNTTKEAKIAATYNEIKEIETAIKEAEVRNKIEILDNSIKILGEYEAPKIDVSAYATQLAGKTGDFYYLDFTSSRKLSNVFDIERVKNDYLLEIDNLNIYMVDGIDINDTTLYDAKEIANFYQDAFVK